MNKVDRSGHARWSLELVSDNGRDALPLCALRDAPYDRVPQPAAERARELREAVDAQR